VHSAESCTYVHLGMLTIELQLVQDWLKTLSSFPVKLSRHMLTRNNVIHGGRSRTPYSRQRMLSI
jgi:hypothetical protein